MIRIATQVLTCLALALAVLVLGTWCQGCGGDSNPLELDGSMVDAGLELDGSTVDAGLELDGSTVDGSVGLPVSHCFDGANARNDHTFCHCIKVCSLDAVYDGYYVCSLEPGDNVADVGNMAGHCLDGRCLDQPLGPCTP